MSNQKAYDRVAAILVERMEKGQVPWRMPWSHVNGGMAKNLLSGKAYRGINAILLPATGFDRPYFLTFNQAKSLGGSVRKGEHGFPVVFFKWLQVGDAKKPVPQGQADGKRIPLLRFYTVFNVAQCEGLKHRRLDEVPEAPREFSVIEGGERIVAGYKHTGPGIRFGGGRACYVPSQDLIEMPQANTFESPEAYYSTLFHEMVHSTGHQSRLDREGVVNPARYQSHTYAAEELVAEFGASFLRAMAGIEKAPEVENSAAYLRSWIKFIKHDPRAVVIAAGQAQKAADFVLGIRAEEEEES